VVPAGLPAAISAAGGGQPTRERKRKREGK